MFEDTGETPVPREELMNWTQAYTPLGSLGLSALVAVVPVCVLLGLLAFSHAKAHFAAMAGLAASLAVAILVYHMPAGLASRAALNGAMFGLFPIGWIVLCAIFVYDITCKTGQFEVVKHSIAGVADDRRIQAILIAFCFGSFIEGAAGFGTPVAISAAMLIGLGFRPLAAAGLALIGNTAPVAFGSLGTPILALSKVTGIPPEILGAMVGKQLAPFALLIPFWLVWAMAGLKGVREVWPACLTAGLSFSVSQFVVSQMHGLGVVDIIASIVSIASMLLLLRFWQPRTVWRFDHESEEPICPTEEEKMSGIGAGDITPSPGTPGEGGGEGNPLSTRNEDPHPNPLAGSRPFRSLLPEYREREKRNPKTRPSYLLAWMPWLIVSVLVFTWGIPPVKRFLNHLAAPEIHIRGLDGHVFRSPPVVPPNAKGEPAIFVFNILSATGTSLLLAGILSGFLLGLSPLQLLRLFAMTLRRVSVSLLTIAAMMAIGFTTRYAGLDATLGLAFAGTGKLFPFFSPLLGWLGVALTGSDTSSNILFGNLQQITARQLGISPILAAAANSSGGVMGKMIDAQSIVVAGVATGQRGGEGQILRYVFFHSIALAILVGVFVLIQAYAMRDEIRSAGPGVKRNRDLNTPGPVDPDSDCEHFIDLRSLRPARTSGRCA